jgi:hypothetical protein
MHTNRQEEVRREFVQQEQEFFRQTALFSNKDKEKVIHQFSQKKVIHQPCLHTLFIANCSRCHLQNRILLLNMYFHRFHASEWWSNSARMLISSLP